MFPIPQVCRRYCSCRSQKILLILLVFLTLPVYAATVSTQLCSSTVPVPIPDQNATGIENTITISSSAKVKNPSVLFSANHEHIGELVVKLKHGTTVKLLDTPGTGPQGCAGKNIVDLKLNDAGSEKVQTSCNFTDPAYDKTLVYTPAGTLNNFDAQPLGGDWTLSVIDAFDYSKVPGTLTKWCLEYETYASSGLTFTFNPASLAFDGEVAVYDKAIKTFTVTAPGEDIIIYDYKFEDISPTDSYKSFTLTDPLSTAFPMILKAGETKTFSAKCEPTQEGTLQANLVLETNIEGASKITYPLQCNSIAAKYNASLSNGATLDFGSVTVGQTTSPQKFTISETSNKVDLKLGYSIRGTHRSDFSLVTQPSSVTKGSSADVELTCKPKEFGPRTAELEVVTNDPTKKTQTYQLTCAGDGAIYKSTPVPGEFNLGAVAPGSTVSRNLTVKNAGNVNLNIKITDVSIIGDISIFSVTMNTDLSIVDGGSENITVHCKPNAETTYTATLKVSHTGVNPPNPAEYPLMCAGSASTVPVYDSTLEATKELDIGNAISITKPSIKTFTIKELGNAALAVSNPNIVGDDASSFSIISPTFPINIADGADPVDVQVQCDPKDTKQLRADLELTTNDPNKLTVSYRLKCYGRRPIYNLLPNADYQAATNTLKVGTQVFGGHVSNELQIKNTGNLGLKLTLPATPIDGPHASDFKIINPIPPTTPGDKFLTIYSNKTKAITIECIPTGLGSRDAVLHLLSNDPDVPTIDYNLTCMSERPLGPGYDSEPGPGSVMDFGQLSVGETKVLPLVVKEVGTTVLNVSFASPAISGTNADMFTVDTSAFTRPTYPSYLSDGESPRTVNVSCKPTKEGEFEAILTLNSDDIVFPKPKYILQCIAGPIIIPPDDPDNPGTLPDTPTVPNPGNIYQVLKVTTTGSGEGFVKSAPPGISCFHLENGEKDCDEEYEQGTTVVLAPSSQPGSTFGGWSDNCKSGRITLDTDQTCTAEFIRNSYTLHITYEGNGVIRASSGDINCGTGALICDNSFHPNQFISLSPRPRDEWYFDRWEGDCDVGGQVRMDSDKTCHAVFKLEADRPSLPPVENAATLSVEKVGEGHVTSKANCPTDSTSCEFAVNINCGDICQVDYPLDLPVAVTATPAEGYTFKGFTGDCDAKGSVVMQENRHCIATFAPKERVYTLTVTKVGEGTVTSQAICDTENQTCDLPVHINCGTTCQGQYSPQTYLGLIPQPAENYIFKGFSGDCNSVGHVIMKADQQCTATFVPVEKPEEKETQSIIGFVKSAYTVKEQTGVVMVTVSRAGSSQGNVKAIYVTESSSAIADQDFTSINGVVSWQEGDKADKTIRISVTDDTLLEPDESFRLQLASLEGNAIFGLKTTTMTILDNDSYRPDEPEDPGEKNRCADDISNKAIICRGDGRTYQDVTIDEKTSISNIKLVGDNKNNGLLSNSTLEKGAALSGGHLTGNIDNQGTLTDVTFVGNQLCGGLLAGTIANDAEVGKICDVTLAENAIITGGRVQGRIVGKSANEPGQLKNLIILEGSYLENVIIGKGVKIAREVTFGPGVYAEDGTLMLPPDGPNIEADGTIRLEPNVYITEDLEKGVYVGDPNAMPMLENLTIKPSSYVTMVIIGQNVTNEGTVINFEFKGRLFKGGAIGGTVINSGGGAITDVTLAPDTYLVGGHLKGCIKGDADAPALIEHVRIVSNSCLDNVILGDGVYLPDDVELGDNVKRLFKKPEEETSEEDETALKFYPPEWKMVSSPAEFKGQVTVCGNVRSRHTLLSQQEAKSIGISSTLNVESAHLGQPAELVVVAKHQPNAYESVYYMRVGQQTWQRWDEKITSLLPAGDLGTLSDKTITIPVFSGGLQNIRGELTIYLGYRLKSDGTIVFNGLSNIHFYIDTTPTQCLVYAVNDAGLNDTQFLIIDLSQGLHGQMKTLGPVYKGRDIEGMALHPYNPDVIYASSGNESKVGLKRMNGHIYQIDRITGELTSLASTGYEQVTNLAVHPTEETLWAWAKNNEQPKWMGLIEVNPANGKTHSIHQVEYQDQYDMGGLTWDQSGSVLYASSKDIIWKVYELGNPLEEPLALCQNVTEDINTFCRKASQEIQQTACESLPQDKKAEIEGLDIQPNGQLLLGVDYQRTMMSTILAYDVTTCQVTNIRSFSNSFYNDLESIVWPSKECNDQSWLGEEQSACPTD